MLLFDETAFAASQELLKGFGPGCPMVVGAPFPCHLPDVGADVKELATQAMTVCMKRCDSKEAVWAVKPPKQEANPACNPACWS